MGKAGGHALSSGEVDDIMRRRYGLNAVSRQRSSGLPLHGRRPGAFHLIGVGIRPPEIGREQGGRGAEED